jgi:Ran GTPase-activating protein (RanGAP) involved in mRNA processing and transport
MPYRTKLVRHVDLSFNEITDVGMEIFARCLEKCNNLESLNLQGNALGSPSAELVSQALSKCEAIKYLNLQYNKVGTAGAIVKLYPFRVLPRIFYFPIMRIRVAPYRN